MPKVTLKRLPTLDLHDEDKPVKLKVSRPSGNSRKLARSLIPISKAAQILQVNPDTLRNWERQGRLIPDRTTGGSRRYNLFELKEIQKQLNIKRKTQVKTPIAGLSVSKAAKLLQVSPDTIRNWDNKGLISSQRASGGARRFSKKLILKLQDEMNIPGNENIGSIRSDWFHFPLTMIILFLILSTGALLGLYTGFQIMNRLDEVSKNTRSIDQNMIDMQKQLVSVSEIVDAARQLSANIKFSSFGSGPQQIDSEAKVLGESTNTMDQIILKGNTIIEGLLTAPNIIYSLIAGDNVAISGGQTPKVTLKLPALVNSLNGATGELKFTGGSDIKVDGLIITNSSTLSSVRSRGGCDNCLIDSDIQDNISISSDGNIDSGAIKKGQLNPEHGGTGLSSFLAGDLLVADSNTSLTVLNAGNKGNTLIIGVSGKPVWSDSLIIDSSTGNVGIGTTAPVAPLEVKGIGATIAKFTNVNTTGCTIADGGTISCVSDASLKKNITDTNYGLSYLMQLHPVSFNWKTEADGTTQSLGFIAQEVENVIPKLVITDSQTGLKELNTIGLVPVLAKAIQEQQQQINSIISVVNTYNLSLDADGNIVLPKVKVDKLVLASDTPLNGATATNYFDVAARVADLVTKTQLQVDVLAAQIASMSAQIAANNSQLESTASVATKSSQTESPQTSAVSDLNLTSPSILLATGSATLTTGASAQLSLHPPVESTLSGTILTYETATFSKTLKSLGETLVGTVIAAGDIVQDGTLSLTDGDTINAIPTLYIQKSDLAASVNFFNGMVTIDKQGDLKAQTIMLSELKVKGNKISGNAKIVSGEKSVEIDNLIVSARSRILVTPTTETDIVLAVTSKEENKKFTVTASKNVPKDITFDWWLINEVD